MENDDLTQFRAWFTEYCRSFKAENDEDRKNFGLKEAHTEEVRANALLIAQGLGLDAGEAALAQAVAVFHDVGRFPQYRDYRTFRDSISKNHAVLGAKVLLEAGVLRDLGKSDRDQIVHAVALHNVFTLPPGLPERTLLHARIVRDADKLDIWLIFIRLLDMPEAERPTAATLGLPESPDCSPEVLAALSRREMVRLVQLRTLNDFKLLQLSWVYDLNFLPSFRLLRERGLISRLAATLPRRPEITRAVDAVRNFVDGRLSGKPS
jgi:hypothetical protein